MITVFNFQMSRFIKQLFHNDVNSAFGKMTKLMMIWITLPRLIKQTKTFDYLPVSYLSTPPLQTVD